ncbi:hypothetical protein [Rhizobium sp. PP-F2F-G48]|uniref:hypothetical protein n=1 Tax=Rhizobium sp. PP-F2F-G48 TaxID=2135651 RepID=UPI0032AED0B3
MYVVGQVGRTRDLQVIEDPQKQFRAIWENLRIVLEAANCTLLVNSLAGARNFARSASQRSDTATLVPVMVSEAASGSRQRRPFSSEAPRCNDCGSI